jgi:rare lipoprotein A
MENDRSVVVTVTDRGPANRRRVIDVSRRAADLLGFVSAGTARVRLDVVPAP